MNIPRAEHPKPQFERKNWRNLNGQWQFEIDNGRSAKARELFKNEITLKDTINVPFCPESALSGIGHTDFMMGVVYKRTFNISKEELTGVTRLHFGAVDYIASVYINEQFAGTHTGGYVSFYFDITDYLVEGTNTVTVIVEDDTRNPLIPSGKQSPEYCSFGCFYTKTTGIWQTVWLEFLPKAHIDKVKYYPNIHDCTVTVAATLVGAGDFSAKVQFGETPVGEYEAASCGGVIQFTIALSEKHLWEVGNGNLYDVIFTYGDDSVTSYFGLRQIRIDGRKFLLNEKSVFQRLVLDQGFYPDGIYTAPSDEALLNDIKLSMAMGFNGARLHEKIFEERFLYHCDRLGYIVWGEYPDWGLDSTNPNNIYAILPEWLEELDRDFNHPAIIGWCPHNETVPQQCDASISILYDITKAIDPTRPCIDSSGYFHVKTDIYDVHDYEQDPTLFASYYEDMENGIMKDSTYRNPVMQNKQSYDGKKAAFVSEYGGIAWCQDTSGWGYGNGPKTEEEFIDRFTKLTESLLQNKNMMALCYTQLTDVEQEQNGLYTYQRQPKFDPKIISAVLQQKAAIED